MFYCEEQEEVLCEQLLCIIPIIEPRHFAFSLINFLPFSATVYAPIMASAPIIIVIHVFLGFGSCFLKNILFFLSSFFYLYQKSMKKYKIF